MSAHCDYIIMGAIASQITSLTIVYSTVYSDADQRKHQSAASLAFVRGIHRGPVNSPHKWPVTRKMFPFDDVIMIIKFTRAYLIKFSTRTRIRGYPVSGSSYCDNFWPRLLPGLGGGLRSQNDFFYQLAHLEQMQECKKTTIYLFLW